MSMTDEILTGEGVLLDARPASFASRILAALVDILVVVVLAVAWTYIVTRLTDLGNSDLVGPIVIGTIATVTVLFPTAVETLTRGRSVGKWALGLRVVRDDGGPVRFRHSFVRALVGLGELWLTVGGVAVLTSIAHPKGKRVGDLLAGTYVIRIRTAGQTLAGIRMPPALAAWARAADIRRLPDGLSLAARTFLGRAATMNPGSRTELGIELAGQLAQHVAPAAPDGTHPEDFIAAVLAERRNREFVIATARAAAAEARSERLHRLPNRFAADPDGRP